MKKKLIYSLFALAVSFNGFAQTDPYNPRPVTNGLVSQWSMENNVNDNVSGNNATATNNLTYVPGRIGQAISLGSGGYCDIPNSANLELQEYTLEIWVKPEGPSANPDQFGGTIFSKDLNPPTGAFNSSPAINWSSATNRFITAVGHWGTQIVYSTNQFPAGHWYHVVSTYDGSTLKLYVNGNLEGSVVMPSGFVIQYDAAQTWNFGTTASYWRSVGYPRTFNGRMDEARIYDRALTPAEIEQNMNYNGINGTITGQVYDDVDGNCSFGTGDNPIVRKMMKAEPGPYYAYTDEQGNYEFVVPAGSYTVSEADPVDLFAVSPCQGASSYNVQVGQGATATGNNFALQALPPTCDASVSIISNPIAGNSPACPTVPISTPCPGSQHQLWITATNDGNTPILPQGSLLTVTLDPNMSYANVIISDDCGFGAPIVTGNVLTWTLPNAIPAGEACTIGILVDVNGLSIPWINAAEFTAGCSNGTIVANDNVQDDNACACDPNDKKAMPEGCGVDGNIHMDQTITYRVRFENIGSGPAHNVIIRDQLDTDFDFESLKLINSSHTVTSMEIIPGDILVIAFENIELPGEYDPSNNKGYVLFSLDPKENVAEGTQLVNQAGIYFDANDPVITNATLNTLRATPTPDASFAAQHSCTQMGLIYDFEYTGSTADNATFLWDFGPNASPSTSTSANPTNIVFTTAGTEQITLTVTRFGCSESSARDVVISDGTGCGGNPNRIALCQNGNNTICVNVNAAQALLNTGNFCLGECPTAKILTSNNAVHEIQVYPNPSDDIFTVEIPEGGAIEYQVLNTLGQVVEQSSINSNKLTLDLGNQDSGIYLLLIQFENTTVTTKIQKR